MYKDQEIACYKIQQQEMQDKLNILEGMEQDQFNIRKQKDEEIAQKQAQVDKIKRETEALVKQKEKELSQINSKMLAMQDEKLDILSKLEGNEGREHVLQEEIIKL